MGEDVKTINVTSSDGQVTFNWKSTLVSYDKKTGDEKKQEVNNGYKFVHNGDTCNISTVVKPKTETNNSAEYKLSCKMKDLFVICKNTVLFSPNISFHFSKNNYLAVTTEISTIGRLYCLI